MTPAVLVLLALVQAQPRPAKPAKPAKPAADPPGFSDAATTRPAARGTATSKPAPDPPGFSDTAQKAGQAREQGRIEEAIQLYRQATRLNPRWAEGWWYLGTLTYERDRYPECRQAFQRFVELDPKAGPGFALLALCEFRTKSYDASLSHLKAARRLGIPANEQLLEVAQYHLALLFNREENYEAALQILALIARRVNGGPKIAEAMGIAALRRPILPDQIKEEDREVTIKIGRAMLAAAERRPDEADRYFHEVAEAFPRTPNVHYSYASFLLASDSDGAVREFLEELEISGAHLPSLVSLALEYLKRGEPEKGLPHAQAAVKAAPRSFAAHAALGRVYLDLDQAAKAIDELKLSVDLEPTSPQTRIALASAYQKIGNKEEAARQRAEFLRLKKELEGEQAQ